MEHRIFGLESEFGVTFSYRGQRRLSPDEVARHLFRRVVHWGRSSNVFLENGSRLYLDVGSHPEYATAECDELEDLVAQDKAGEWILSGLVQGAQARLHEDGIKGEVFLFKNNTDSAGNSYGCHENYLVGARRRARAPERGHDPVPREPPDLRRRGQGPAHRQGTDLLRQPARRAHLGVGLVGDHEEPSDHQHPRRAPRRRRAVPAAPRDRRRHQHVRVRHVPQGRATCLMLAMVEDTPTVLRDLTLENPIRAIREISQDPTCKRKVKLANGREISALEIQTEYLDRATRFAERRGLPTDLKQALEMWRHCITGLERDPMSLDREVDWVMKLKLIEQVRERHSVPLSHPMVSVVDLRYHDIDRTRGLFYKMQSRGLADRTTTDEAITEATTVPAADDAGAAAGCVREARQGAAPGLYGRLGAPEAQRPGAAHRAARRTRSRATTSGSND